MNHSVILPAEPVRAGSIKSRYWRNNMPKHKDRIEVKSGTIAEYHGKPGSCIIRVSQSGTTIWLTPEDLKKIQEWASAEPKKISCQDLPPEEREHTLDCGCFYGMGCDD